MKRSSSYGLVPQADLFYEIKKLGGFLRNASSSSDNDLTLKTSKSLFILASRGSPSRSRPPRVRPVEAVHREARTVLPRTAVRCWLCGGPLRGPGRRKEQGGTEEEPLPPLSITGGRGRLHYRLLVAPRFAARGCCPMERPRSSSASACSGSSGSSSPAIALGKVASRLLRTWWGSTRSS